MIRNTKQRDALIQVIRDADRPLSPAEIHQLALLQHPGIGLRTIYRHIKDLVESQEIAGISYPGQPMRYEIVDTRGSRPHLICRDCQNVFDLPIKEPNVAYPDVEGFTIEGHEVVFFGRCAECEKEAKRKK